MIRILIAAILCIFGTVSMFTMNQPALSIGALIGAALVTLWYLFSMEETGNLA